MYTWGENVRKLELQRHVQMALKTVLKEIEANKTFGQPQDRNKYVYSKEQIFD